MERWKLIVYMTAIYMFLTECRPIEPYMSAYLTGPDVNISLSEVAYTVEAIKAYSALVVGTLMLFTADYLLYKPNLIFLTVWSCLSYMLITGSPSLARVRVSAAGLGAMFSASILAYSYLYAQIEDVNQFQVATGIVSAAVQLGRGAGDLSAQFTMLATGGSYTILPYITMGALFLAIICVASFPSVKLKHKFLNTSVPSEKSSLLERNLKNTTEHYGNKHGEKKSYKEDDVSSISFENTWLNFKTSYSNPTVLKGCLWYIFGMGAYIEVLSNMNVLYSYVATMSTGHQNVSANGFAETMVTLSGAAGAYIMGRVKLDWDRHGDLFTAFTSIVMGVLMISCYFYSQLYFVYISNMLFSLLCQALFVMVLTDISKNLEKQCYSIVLEFNYIASVIVANFTTLFLIQFNFMGITIPGRFLFFGSYFVILGMSFLFNSLTKKNKSAYY